MILGQKLGEYVPDLFQKADKCREGLQPSSSSPFYYYKSVKHLVECVWMMAGLGSLTCPSQIDWTIGLHTFLPFTLQTHSERLLHGNMEHQRHSLFSANGTLDQN